MFVARWTQDVFNLIHRVLKLLIFISFVTLLSAVCLQVFSRLFLPRPPVWTEELSRFCLLYLTAFGAGLALRTGELANVDLFGPLLGDLPRRLADAFVAGVVLLFALALIPPSLDFVAIGQFQRSPALLWNMYWIHLAVLVAPVTLAIAAIERLFQIVMQEPGQEPGQDRREMN